VRLVLLSTKNYTNMNHLESVTPKRNKWWWYLLTIVGSVVGASIICGMLEWTYYLYMHIRTGNSLHVIRHAFKVALKSNNNLEETLTIELLAFALVLLCIIVLIKVIHGRKWTEVINGTNHIRWSRLFHGFAFWGGMMLVGYLIDYIFCPNIYVWQFKPEKFIPLFFISLLFIFQTSYEELICRGYLAQGFASWTKSRWCALIFPTIIFAFGHSSNPECAGYGYGIMMASYALIGLTFGLMTILDDGAELAIGAHTANNMLGSLLVNYKDSALPTDSLFYTTQNNPYQDFISNLIFAIILIIIMARVYKWKFNVINKKVVIREN